MAARQLMEFNHKHLAIAEYLLQHPSARMYEVAEALNMSTSWLSVVVNSELFRNYLMERHKEIGGTVALSLHDKVHGVAHAAVEKLGRMVDESTDADFILATADRTMHRLGMGPTKSGGPTVNVQTFHGPVQNNTSVNPAIVAAARDKIHQLAGVTNAASLPSAEGVQASHDSPRGEVPFGETLLHTPEES